jgi:metal-responsive CopG/Arc/MetJ family transcriptional regulator
MLLKISTRRAKMATVNFSIPEDIKQAFQEAFASENKSAVIARLMRQAIEEKRREQRRAAAIEALLELRGKQTPVTKAEIRRARQMGRP